MKLPLKQIILCCGANNPPRKEESEISAYNIMNLAKTITTGAIKVAVSDVIPEMHIFNRKHICRNLNPVCREENISFIYHILTLEQFLSWFEWQSCDSASTILQNVLSDTEVG